MKFMRFPRLAAQICDVYNANTHECPLEPVNARQCPLIPVAILAQAVNGRLKLKPNLGCNPPLGWARGIRLDPADPS